MRTYRPEVNEAVGCFGMSLDTIHFYGKNDPHVIDFGLERDLTFADLDGLAEYFGTRDISIKESENGYYGGCESEKVTVTIPYARLDEFAFTEEQTEKMEDERMKQEEKSKLEWAVDSAKRAGVTAKDLA